MQTNQLVLIGGSAGSFDPLRTILSHVRLRDDAALVVVLHQHRHRGHQLADVLATDSPIPIQPIEDKAPIAPGVVHVCPANYHVLVEDNSTFALSDDPPVNYARPSIDLLFLSATRSFPGKLIGVLLSGASADGALGLAAIKNDGGYAICQDPTTAIDTTMPSAGCAATHVDWIGSPQSIAEKLEQLGDG